MEEKDHGAGLIGQTIPDAAETEPRLSILDQILLAARTVNIRTDDDAFRVVGFAAAIKALEAAQERIQAECGMCDGHGYTIETGTESGHACDGTEESCLQNCPVPIPVQVQEQCEYCGRPIGVIALLAAELIATGNQATASPLGSVPSVAK